jgi:hypothetical protein
MLRAATAKVVRPAGLVPRRGVAKFAASSFRRFKETSSMLRSSSLLWVLWVLFALAGVAVDAPAQGWVDRTGPNGPAARTGHAMCYDPVRGYMLMVGQYNSSSNSNYPNWQAETWSWNGTAWSSRGSAPLLVTQVGSGGYIGSNNYAMAVHGQGGDVFLAGQQGSTNGIGPITIWRWDGTAWSSVANGLAVTNGRDVAMAHDPARGQTVVFSADQASQVMIYDGVSWTTRTVTSAPQVLSASGSYRLSMAFDSAVGRIVLALNDLGDLTFPTRFFEWSGFGWNQRLPSVLPPRGVSVLSTDSTRGKVVAVDRDAYTPIPNHTWSYVNGVMQQLITPIEPSLRFETAMAYDPVRGVHVLFGGYNGFLLADTWEFDLGPLASFMPYGTGCAGSRGVPTLIAQTNSLPRIGQTFTTRTTNLPWTGPALMLVGLSDTNYSGTPLPADLSMLSAPGCFLRTSIDDVQPVQNVLGTALWSFVIPPVPGAQFFLQTVPFDPAANPLNLTFSNGGRAVVGL